MSAKLDIQTMTKITVHSGELTVLINYKKEPYYLCFNDQYLPKLARITPTTTISNSKHWPVSKTDTTATLLRNWLADVPVVSIDEVIEYFDLNDYLTLPVAAADINLNYRLLALRAILDGAAVIEFVSPGETEDFGALLYGLQHFLYEHYEEDHTVPAFILSDADDLLGLMSVADRVLELKNGKVKELAVYA